MSNIISSASDRKKAKLNNYTIQHNDLTMDLMYNEISFGFSVLVYFLISFYWFVSLYCDVVCWTKHRCRSSVSERT